MRRGGLARWIPLGICLGGVGYLALKPSPSAETIPYLPRGLVTFFDTHDALNNIMAFAILAAVVHGTLSGWRREPWRVLLRRVLILETLVISLELAQLWIPRRTCDWHDMMNGLIGLIIAALPWCGGTCRTPTCFNRGHDNPARP